MIYCISVWLNVLGYIFLKLLLFFAVPPSIRAVNSNFTAEVGSQVTLGCVIISLGIPIAEITWMKAGHRITGDRVTMNSSFVTLTLNVRGSSNGGTYTCSASNGVQTRTAHIEVAVLEKPESKYLEYSASIILTEFDKTSLPHTSNFRTWKNHNSR